MLFRAFLAGAAVAALTAAPASAEPTLDPLKPCYVAATPEQREYVMVHGRGFTEAKPVEIYVDDIVQTAPLADYGGELSGSVQAPFVDEGQRVFTLRLTESGNAVNTVTAIAKVTRLEVEQVPAKARTGQRVRFRGRGFTDLTRPIYAHYVFAGRSRSTVRIGLPEGDCGLFSIRRKQFPFKKSPRRGLWTIWFDQERVYNPQAAVRVPLTVKVRKRIRPQRAQAR
jgi:hypothetical protein